MIKKILITLNSILIAYPSIVCAGDLSKDYDKIVDISKVFLSTFAWIGYALAMRNINFYRNKIFAKHSKRKGKHKRNTS